MLELDIILTSFVAHTYTKLSPQQLSSFDALLNYADNDLWDLLTEKTQSHDEHQQGVLHLLRENMLKQEAA
jgi:succinate dehydrogenase flavin-adding protein (antitoxin of CptAB toxin-antitoxin module)